MTQAGRRRRARRAILVGILAAAGLQAAAADGAGGPLDLASYPRTDLTITQRETTPACTPSGYGWPTRRSAPSRG